MYLWWRLSSASPLLWGGCWSSLSTRRPPDRLCRPRASTETTAQRAEIPSPCWLSWGQQREMVANPPSSLYFSYCEQVAALYTASLKILNTSVSENRFVLILFHGNSPNRCLTSGIFMHFLVPKQKRVGQATCSDPRDWQDLRNFRPSLDHSLKKKPWIWAGNPKPFCKGLGFHEQIHGFFLNHQAELISYYRKQKQLHRNRSEDSWQQYMLEIHSSSHTSTG